MEIKEMAAAVISLPPDIIFQILLRLRVKTLCRFRCVSKSWHALISDPIFRRSHYNRSKNHPLLLTMCSNRVTSPGCQKQLQFISLDKERNPIAEFNMTMPRGPFCWHPSSTCLDLVLMDHEDETISLLNPATEERIVLPPNNIQDHRDLYLLLAVYLGRVSSTNTYKIFTVFKATIRRYKPVWHFEILSFDNDNGSNNNNWRAVGNHPPSMTLGGGVGACVNGAVYHMPDYYVHSPSDGIARFDLEREEWSAVPLPDSLSLMPLPSWASLRLCQVRGLVCLLHLPRADRNELDLWVLKDSCDKNIIWVKEYSCIDIPSKNLLLEIHFPIAFEEDGRLLMELDGKLGYYDPMRKTFEKISVNGQKRLQSYDTCSFYVESFMSLGTR